MGSECGPSNKKQSGLVPRLLPCRKAGRDSAGEEPAAGYEAKKEYICMCDKVLQKHTYNLCKRTFILLSLFVSST